MKITVRIVTTAERTNGTIVTLDRTVISHTGDNPAFERNETKYAIEAAAEAFVSANALGGTRPL